MAHNHDELLLTKGRDTPDADRIQSPPRADGQGPGQGLDGLERPKRRHHTLLFNREMNRLLDFAARGRRLASQEQHCQYTR
jgi:hypothetical protein